MKGHMTVEHTLYYADKEIRLSCRGVYDANGNKFNIHFYRIDATTDAETLPNVAPLIAAFKPDLERILWRKAADRYIRDHNGR